jgi:hypothetical protein
MHLTLQARVQLGRFGQPHLCGAVLEASAGNCSIRLPPGRVRGAAAVTLPTPTAVLSLSAAAPALACFASAAAAPPISLPPHAALSATVRLSDGSSRTLVDSRALFTTSAPCRVLRSAAGAPFVAAARGAACAPGVCTIRVAFPSLGAALSRTLSLPLVDVAELVAVPQRYDAPASCTLGANETLMHAAARARSAAALRLAPLACAPNEFQQASVCVVARLAAGSAPPPPPAAARPLLHPPSGYPEYVDVTTAARVSVSGAARAAVLPNLASPSVRNRIRPLESGALAARVTFAGRAAVPVAISAMSPAAAVYVRNVSLALAAAEPSLQACDAQCLRTLAGPRSSSQPLLATVTLSDGFQYSAGALLGASAAPLAVLNVSRILRFSSSVPAAASVGPHGDVMLLGNAASAVTLRVEVLPACTGTSGPVASSIAIHANLEPAFLDVDVGEAAGPPIQAQLQGTPLQPHHPAQLLQVCQAHLMHAQPDESAMQLSSYMVFPGRWPVDGGHTILSDWSLTNPLSNAVARGSVHSCFQHLAFRRRLHACRLETPSRQVCASAQTASPSLPQTCSCALTSISSGRPAALLDPTCRTLQALNAATTCLGCSAPCN